MVTTVIVNKQYIDTAELTRFGQEVRGQAPIARFERLTEDLPEQADTFVSWSVQGERNSAGQFFLHLHVQGEVVLECQRCMSSLQWRLDFKNSLQVVRSDTELEEAQDVYVEGLDDTMVEAIAGSPRLDVLALVEDEIILGLPYVPKHDVCPTASDDDAETDPNPLSPFAVLGQLKKD